MHIAHGLVLLLILASASGFAQQTTWVVEYEKQGKLLRVEVTSFLSVGEDSLNVVVDGEQQRLHLSGLRLIRSSKKQSTIPYILTGSALGAGIGYMSSQIGELNRTGGESKKNNALIFVAIGAVTGALVGSVVPSSGEGVYNLALMENDDRKRLLGSFMEQDGTGEEGLPSPGGDARADAGTREETKVGASTRLLLFGGAGIPAGDFASSSSRYGGGATTGFAVGLEAAREFNLNIALTLALAFSKHGFNQDFFPDAVAEGSWNNVWITPGVRLTANLRETWRLFLAGYGGFLTSTSPGLRRSPTESLEGGTGSSFAYGAGAGAFFSDNFCLGMRYLKSEPTFKLKHQNSGSTVGV